MAASAFGLTLLFFFSSREVSRVFKNNHGENLRTTGFQSMSTGVMGPSSRTPALSCRVELPERTGHDAK